MFKVTVFLPWKDSLPAPAYWANKLSDSYTLDIEPKSGVWKSPEGKVFFDDISQCIIYTDNPDSILVKIPEIRDQLGENCIAVEISQVEFRLI